VQLRHPFAFLHTSPASLSDTSLYPLQTQFLLGAGAPYNAGELESYLPTRPAPDQPRPRFELTEAHYRIARHRLLSEVAFVGLLEEYDATLVLLADRLGWTADPVPRPAIAKTTHHRGLDRVSGEELRALKHANRWDMKLYRLAVTLFEQQVRWFGGRDHLQQVLSSRTTAGGTHTLSSGPVAHRRGRSVFSVGSA
jgi:hypothetical protein